MIREISKKHSFLAKIVSNRQPQTLNDAGVKNNCDAEDGTTTHSSYGLSKKQKIEGNSAFLNPSLFAVYSRATDQHRLGAHKMGRELCLHALSVRRT